MRYPYRATCTAVSYERGTRTGLPETQMLGATSLCVVAWLLLTREGVRGRGQEGGSIAIHPQDLSGWGAARAEDAQGTPAQSHIPPMILVYEGKQGEECA